MLEVIELTKIFKDNKKKENIALDRVSFNLPSKGFAFIVGKSGSGKTTLLSLIGGIDDITSGEVIYNGNRLSEFKHNEFDLYRNNEVGFIFQDYHLLEELTIYDNIKMMLDFKGISDTSSISRALESVGLKGYENRYPRELSGGEKQRVAIARIIVKRPSIILADEPTGNLDRKTTKQILDLLKEISKERLVLMVSHNLLDAYSYGDYVLKLEKGRIVEKYMKPQGNARDFRVEDNTLYISKDRYISGSEVDDIKKSLGATKINAIKQNEIELIPYNDEVNEKAYKIKKNGKHISFINSLKYSHRLLRGGALKCLVMSLILGILISVSALCFLISAINENSIRGNLYNKIAGSDYKIGMNSYSPMDENICNEAIARLKPKHAYRGYLSINNNPSISFAGYDEANSSLANRSLIYIVDEDFLARHFGENSHVEFIAKRENELKDGFYVTDAFIDNLNRHISTNEEYIGIVENGFDNKYSKFRVNGIIKTDINERYSDILTKVDRFDMYKNIGLANKDLDRLLAYINELYLYYGGLYTYNENIYNDIMLEGKGAYLNLVAASYNNKNIELLGEFLALEKLGLGLRLQPNEIILNNTNYTSLTGKVVDKTQYKPIMLNEPIDIEVGFYEKYDSSLNNEITHRTFRVVGINNGPSIASIETLMDIRGSFYKPTGLLMEGIDDLDELLKFNQEHNCALTNIEEGAIGKVCTLVTSLRGFFSFILAILITATIILIALYFNRSLKHKLFEIGVMKSLGARYIDINNMLILDFILVQVLTITIFIAFELPLVAFSNGVLFSGVKNVSALLLFNSNLVVLSVDFKAIALISLLIILVFSAIHFITFSKIRRIKPINIIKAKE